MRSIIAEIVSLIQHINTVNTAPESYRPACCPCCGRAGLWRHGTYPRKADRRGISPSCNPILIPRYYCPHCRHTCSVLPECIPPDRWYLWDVQSIALVMLSSGVSAYAITKKMAPSRCTIARWAARLKDQFHLHKDTLCGYFVDLGRTSNFSDFWLACLNKISLAEAMRLCHVAGVAIP